MHSKALQTVLSALVLIGGTLFGAISQAAVIFHDVADVTVVAGQSMRIHTTNGQAGIAGTAADPGAGSNIVMYYSFNDPERPLATGGFHAVKDGQNNSAAMLSQGTVVGAGSDWATGGTYFLDFISNDYPWTGGGTGYLGFFSGGFYGYLHLTYDDAGDSVTLHDMAYEDQAGVSITMGAGNPANAVPTPAGLLLIGLGLGVIGLKRRLSTKQG